jgi:hypothetical protein
MLYQRLLRLDGGQHRGPRALERHEEPVPLGLDLVTAAGREGGAHDAAVIIQDTGVRRITQLLDQVCGSLDVREQKRNRPGG